MARFWLAIYTQGNCLTYESALHQLVCLVGDAAGEIWFDGIQSVNTGI